MPVRVTLHPAYRVVAPYRGSFAPTDQGNFAFRSDHGQLFHNLEAVKE
jgi:hypothetical protein